MMGLKPGGEIYSATMALLISRAGSLQRPLVDDNFTYAETHFGCTFTEDELLRRFLATLRRRKSPLTDVCWPTAKQLHTATAPGRVPQAPLDGTLIVMCEK